MPVKADNPVVRAVLFFSPTCPHCHKVMTEDLPPLREQYGEQLQIVEIDTTQPEGQTLYQAAIERYAIPEERLGVPTLIIGDTVLVGSGEIPEYLPGLIEHHLARGGVDWPDIPGLADWMSGAGQGNGVASEPTPVLTASPQDSSRVEPPYVPNDLIGVLDRFNNDPLGNSLSVFVLLGMIASVLFTAVRLFRVQASDAALEGIAGWRTWIVALLCVAGLGVALYLAYVETTQTLAVCGPVGDCNTVQQSEYARLFGLIPVGIVGAAGYLLILVAWSLGHFVSGALKDWAMLSVFGMALVGTLFSIYLTFLEPFVIGATCLWCLSSAVSMTIILLLVTDWGASAWLALIRLPRQRRISAPQP
jgi:uncharacterized membrane protein/glutaredoxin